MKTIAIIGGTGGTGKWAVKGALLKGYKVNIVNSCQLHLQLRHIYTHSDNGSGRLLLRIA